MDLTLTGDVTLDVRLRHPVRDRHGAAPRARRAASSTTASPAPRPARSQYSVEAWVIPANTTQEGPARIITYSPGSGARNFTLGQVLYNYDFRNRSVARDRRQRHAGARDLRRRPGPPGDAPARRHHLRPVRGRRICVDGLFTDDVDPMQPPGRLWNWDPNYMFALGNEAEQRPPVARPGAAGRDLRPRADRQPQIMQNFDAGVGQPLHAALRREPLGGRRARPSSSRSASSTTSATCSARRPS